MGPSEGAVVILFDTKDAAKIARVPESTIRRWLSKKWLAGYGTRPTQVDIDEMDGLIERLGRRNKRAQ